MQTKLGVNIDHVATIREARKTNEPDVVCAVLLSELAGAHCITAHLREDRRHINDRDVRLIKQVAKTKFNLEMSCAQEIVNIALEIQPDQVTLVPEKREEITTEGGLDVAGDFDRIKDVVDRFREKKIPVSLFVDPDEEQIKACKKTSAEFIEIHTGSYANVRKESDIVLELDKIKKAVKCAKKLGLRVNAGHGLNYINVRPIALIEDIEELNIGHSIVSRAVFVGLGQAVKEMLQLLGD
ncbi:pyridoxine 5'-phosphate synthase [bacterium]|nr:pyridoxine 5'-phosphate synthase [bacterium]